MLHFILKKTLKSDTADITDVDLSSQALSCALHLSFPLLYNNLIGIILVLQMRKLRLQRLSQFFKDGY